MSEQVSESFDLALDYLSKRDLDDPEAFLSSEGSEQPDFVKNYFRVIVEQFSGLAIWVVVEISAWEGFTEKDIVEIPDKIAKQVILSSKKIASELDKPGAIVEEDGKPILAEPDFEGLMKAVATSIASHIDDTHDLDNFLNEIGLSAIEAYQELIRPAFEVAVNSTSFRKLN